MSGLSSARVVLCAGGGLLVASGWLDPLRAVAGALGASIGATRAVVDAVQFDGGQFDASSLVGASGVVIGPELYVGLGVSGAPFHDVGEPAHVVAVNTDVGAALMRRADLALPTDAAALLAALADRLGGFAPGGFAPGGFAPGGFAPGGFAPGSFALGSSAVGGFAVGGKVAGGARVGVRKRHVPGGGPHERLRALIGESGPVRPSAPLGAADAADALIGFLRHHGYLGDSPE
ncbi:FAD-binding protein [Cryptosporangium sp. NPDC051539]|uniref:FAD-binding protein n=1 Tax=Cryptosporangium sp. NPDC051539 TaxID=3363962 RepID=UPI00379DB76D